MDDRHRLVPGGAHTYSKGDDQFPAIAPPMIERGDGAYVWGSNGKRYLDWCMGLRSVTLGHAQWEVVHAVEAAAWRGTNFGRPSPLEFELAERLVSLLPGVEMVKFAKNGSTVVTAATKLARAYTGRKMIAVCADQPFFSYDDWFIGTTPMNAGIPEEISRLTTTFRYNDLPSLQACFDEHPGDIACVVMEALTTEEPADRFLQEVQLLCRRNGAVFVLDEMITGVRHSWPGAARHYGLQPDLTTFGKGIANGFSLAVLGGRRDIMDLGGLRSTWPRVFLISTTHGAETTGLAAGLKTLEVMERDAVQEAMASRGTELRDELRRLISRLEVPGLRVVGYPANLSLVVTAPDGTPSPLHRTLLMQEVIRRGLLWQGYFAISAAHRDRAIRATISVFEEALAAYGQMLEDPASRLIGEPVKPVFRRDN